MRTQVIPAQITTVEDKIAGNLNLIQIMLLIFPAFWATLVYAILPPRMHLSLFKLPLVIFVLILCLVLAVRIKGRVLISWLGTIIRYNLRPQYYVFNKNDRIFRSIEIADLQTRPKTLASKKVDKEETQKNAPAVSIGNLVRLESIFTDPKYSFSFKLGRKGGLDVAFKQEQK